MIDPILKKQLERDEGRRLVAYRDNAAARNWTIGVGHLLGGAPRMSSVTDAECDALLNADVDVAVDSLTRVFGQRVARVEPARFRALVNMMFNRGEQHVRDSTTITPAIKQALDVMPHGDWSAVSAAVLASPWAVQIGARAQRLAKQFETGEDQ